MCGIAGFTTNGIKQQRTADISKQISEEISHRGPDDSGEWCCEKNNLVLIHRRLAIQDLTKNGHQPAISIDKRYVMVFNGEIYNHRSLKKELPKNIREEIKGGCDTNILIELISYLGVDRTLEIADGMFAFGLMDRKENTLTLCKDLFGEKPLYVYEKEGNIAFASELKAITKLPYFKKEIRKEAVAHMIRRGYIPTPLSIYESVEKIKPGTYRRIDLKTYKKVEKQWNSVKAIIQKGKSQQVKSMKYDEQINKIRETLEDSVRSRLTADVPIGIFLSGGIDSSLITAIAAKLQKNTRTFSIGFEDKNYDESRYAKEVARCLGVEHKEYIVTAEDLLNTIKEIPLVYDEPFSDASQMPTLILSKLTSENVKVALAGDGGDEIFGGYNRHFFLPKLIHIIRLIPASLKPKIKRLIRKTRPEKIDKIIEKYKKIIPKKLYLPRLGDNIHKISSIITSTNKFDLYDNVTSQWQGEIPIREQIPYNTTGILQNKFRDYEFLKTYGEKIMAVDTETYLVDDILVKTDRASMWSSLEVRSPFLNPSILEEAWKLPLSTKIKGFVGKKILRDLCATYIPRHLIDRPKSGFGMPIDTWLRTSLKDWADNIIKDSANNPYIDIKKLKQEYELHMSGVNRQYPIWNTLMFLCWYNYHIK